MDKPIRRVKLSVEQQIEHMSSKGIQFTIDDKETAANYLSDNTYYFKLKAYAKLYDKYKTGENEGKYIGLEFAYLRDLATIDSLLRKKILTISIDIEHYLKVQLLKDFNESNEDGYEIVEEFISWDPDKIKKDLKEKLFGKACSNLVKKYIENFAIWNFIEVISFKDFATLYSMFYERNPELTLHKYGKRCARGPYYYYLNPVRLLRNAAAHSNCLISSLRVPYVSPKDFNNNPQVSTFLGQNGIKNTTLNKQMFKPFIHDFCVMLYLYHQVAPISAQRYVFADLRDFLDTRVTKNKVYYHNKNATIESAYEFIKKVVDVFCDILKI